MTWTWMDAVYGLIGAIGGCLLILAIFYLFERMQFKRALRDEKRHASVLKTARQQQRGLIDESRTNRERPWPNEPWH